MKNKTESTVKEDWKKEAEDTVGNIAFDARFHKKKPTIKELCNKYMFPFIENLLQEQKKSIIKNKEKWHKETIKKVKNLTILNGGSVGDTYNQAISDILDLLNQNR